MSDTEDAPEDGPGGRPSLEGQIVFTGNFPEAEEPTLNSDED